MFTQEGAAIVLGFGTEHEVDTFLGLRLGIAHLHREEHQEVAPDRGRESDGGHPSEQP